MNEEYIYNIIAGIVRDLPADRQPRCATWLELIKSVTADVQQIVNNLVATKRVTFKRDVNKQPLLFVNENS